MRNNVPTGIYGNREVTALRRMVTVINGEATEDVTSDVGLTSMWISREGDSSASTGLVGSDYVYWLPNNVTPFMSFADKGKYDETSFKTPVCMTPMFDLKEGSLAEKLIRGISHAMTDLTTGLMELCTVELDEDTFYITFDDENVAPLKEQIGARLPQVLVYSKLKGDVLPRAIVIDPNSSLFECANSPNNYVIPPNGRVGVAGFGGMDAIFSLGDYDAQGERISKDSLQEATLVFIDRFLFAMLIEGPEVGQNIQNRTLQSADVKYDMLSTLFRMIPGAIDTLDSKVFKMINFGTHSGHLEQVRKCIGESYKFTPSNTGMRAADAAAFICRYLAFQTIYKMFHEMSFFSAYQSPIHDITVRVHAPLRFAGLLSASKTISSRLAGHQLTGKCVLTDTSNDAAAETGIGQGAVDTTWLNVSPDVVESSTSFGFAWLALTPKDSWPAKHRSSIGKRTVEWKNWYQTSFVARPALLRTGAARLKHDRLFTNLHPEDVATDYELEGRFDIGKVEYVPRSYLDEQARTTTYYQSLASPLPKTPLTYEAFFSAIVLGRESCLSGDSAVRLAQATPDWHFVDHSNRDSPSLFRKVSKSISDLWKWHDESLGDGMSFLKLEDVQEKEAVVANWFASDIYMEDEISRRVEGRVKKQRLALKRKAEELDRRFDNKIASIPSLVTSSAYRTEESMLSKYGVSDNSTLVELLRKAFDR